jgi:hypothetical protein
MPATTDIQKNKESRQYLLVFGCYWLATFLIYLPAAKAGFVGDFPYWISQIKTFSFWQFVNTENALTLYHAERMNVYILYKLLGAHPWLWHLVFISLHAVNGFLCFRFFKTLFSDSGIQNAALISFIGAALFIVCPHASEAVVWDAVNHFLLTPILIFLILLYTQKFIKTQRPAYPFITAAIYFYSSFSLEFFYLTPWLVLMLLLYYRIVVNADKAIIQKAFARFFIPLIALFIVHLVLLRVISKTSVSHYGDMSLGPIRHILSMPLKYLFHTIFMGRFFSVESRRNVYAFCVHPATVALAYSILALFWGYTLARVKRVFATTKTLAWLSGCIFCIYLFMSPLIFPELFVVVFDRYTYLSNLFTFPFIALLVSTIRFKQARAAIIGIYMLVNLGLAVRVNSYWGDSADIIGKLLNNFPDPGNKTVLLLNLPYCFNGVPMIAAHSDSRFKAMKNALSDHPINNAIYDVSSYNMNTKNDGAHIFVANDSTINVTLNQWGTWWMYEMGGALSYENQDFKVNMVDPGHWYQLTLKKPAEHYLLLYQTGDTWKTVGWNKKNEDQY